ncbi:hypothetical protein [Parafrankia sp. BMG5.11]|uniref:hypothetical protein n=1 Tax=Parafrankia sp. BMG5.11 TaxID=222540 RepID=UPI0035A14CC5
MTNNLFTAAAPVRQGFNLRCHGALKFRCDVAEVAHELGLLRRFRPGDHCHAQVVRCRDLRREGRFELVPRSYGADQREAGVDARHRWRAALGGCVGQVHQRRGYEVVRPGGERLG